MDDFNDESMDKPLRFFTDCEGRKICPHEVMVSSKIGEYIVLREVFDKGNYYLELMNVFNHVIRLNQYQIDYYEFKLKAGPILS